MKKQWRRGLLLGVSIALLLSGGVALAASLEVWPDCFQCFPGSDVEFGDQEPGYPYSFNWESCGWEPGEDLIFGETFANGLHHNHYFKGSADGSGCGGGGPWGWTCEGDTAPNLSQDEVAAALAFPEDFWGPFEICVQPDTENDEVGTSAIVCETILFAEVCPEEVEEEFVPEPGTIALLGSGLAGLAGYATLRWRTRE